MNDETEGRVNDNEPAAFYERDPFRDGWAVPDAAREWMGEGV